MTDTAHLAAASPPGPAPTGTITFSVFAPNNATCTGAPVFTSTVPATMGAGNYTSGPFTPMAPGTYHWIAAYSGDANNAPATTACGDAGETSTIAQATPAIVTTASAPVTVGGSISDSAVLSGGVSPTGNVVFTLFGPNNPTCTGAPVFTSTKTVAGNGTYASDSFTTTAVGTYQFVAAYGGDANNAAVTSACGAANENTTVTQAIGGGATVVATKTADQAVAVPGAADGYAVTLTNTGTAAAPVTSISDTLPAGFTYVSGSTTGAITSDPAVAAGVLTWSGTFSVPASGSLTFHFGVHASSVAGHYTNSVAATNGATAVASVTATAPIDVAATGAVPAFPVEGLPIALILGGGILFLWWRRRPHPQLARD